MRYEKRMTLELDADDAAKFRELAKWSGAPSLASAARSALRVYWGLLRVREHGGRTVVLGANGSETEVTMPSGELGWVVATGPGSNAGSEAESYRQRPRATGREGEA